MTPPDPASALLHEAARVIARRGWHQGAATSPDGRVCVLQALGRAAVRVVVFDDVVWEAQARLSRVVGQSPVAWNDSPSTSYEDVALALKQAAELAP